MKITQDVRDYSAGLGDNEKRALEEMSEAERQRGMETMSAKYAEVGGRLYVSEERAEEETVTAEDVAG